MVTVVREFRRVLSEKPGIQIKDIKMKYTVGEPLYVCRRRMFNDNELEIVRYFVQKYDGEWLTYGPSMHILGGSTHAKNPGLYKTPFEAFNEYLNQRSTALLSEKREAQERIVTIDNALQIL